MTTFYNADRTNAFVPSHVPGSYVSTCGRYGATLRPAGNYEMEGKLVRHYAIHLLHGSRTCIGHARTLREAARLYL